MPRAEQDRPLAGLPQSPQEHGEELTATRHRPTPSRPTHAVGGRAIGPIGTTPSKFPPAPKRHQGAGVRSCNVWQGIELGDSLRRPAVHRVPEIPILLQAEPEVGRHADHSRQPQGRIGCDPTLAANDFVQPRKGDSQPHRQCRLGDPERFEELLEQHLAGMSRRTPARQCSLH